MESLILLFVIFLSVAAYEPFIETGIVKNGSSNTTMLGMQGSSRSSSIPDTTKQNLVETYIVGGTEAKRGAYPWIVKSVTDFGTCTATLIHSDMALTAAHCQGVFGGGVYISAFDYENNEDDGSIYREVDRQYRNLGYNQNNSIVVNDIMIIRLATPVENVPLIQLNQDSNVPTDFEQLLALGFGLTSLDGELPTQLMEVEMNAIPSETCTEALNLFDNVKPGPGIMCAGSRSGQASTCNGDSGGPLLTRDGLVQVGITSFGVNCDTVYLPNGFTRVSYYYDWIQETICKYSNDRPADCPEPEGPDPDAVPVNVTIRHDFYPAETTWAIRDKSDNTIKVAGPIGNPTELSLWYTMVALVPGDYSFEIYDQRGNGMGSIYPETAGFFELSTEVEGKSEILVPLTLGYFAFNLTTDFEVPTIKDGDYPTSSPAFGLSSFISSSGPKNNSSSLVPSDVALDVPTYSPSLRLYIPSSASFPLPGELNEGSDGAPTMTSSAMKRYPKVRGGMICTWIITLVHLFMTV